MKAERMEPVGNFLEGARAQQREVCLRLLERWLPLALAEAMAVEREGRSGPVIEEEAFESGLKAGAFGLKLLERLSKRDGLDADDAAAASPKGRTTADPVELARRVEAVSPLLAAKLHGGGNGG
jgi:hypothetical protein